MFAAASVKFSSVVPIEVFPLTPGSVVWERPAAVKGAPGRARRSAPLTARSVPRESEERGKTVTDQPGNNLTRTPRISRPVTLPDFGAQYPAYSYPCPTLQVHPYDCPPMAR